MSKRIEMMKISLILLLFLASLFLKAQDSVPELITDRPDQTESSSVVPHKSLQIETGFILETRETDVINQNNFAYNTTLLRYGLFDNFELRLGLEYLGENEEIKASGAETRISGLSPVYAGFKVKIADEDGIKPEIAFLGGLVLPFTATEEFKPEYTSANVRFSFSHTLSDKLSLGYNLGAEWDGESAIPGYFYSLALGIGLTDHIGMFVEGYGLIPEEGEAEHLFDAGFTFLLLPTFQLDLSGGLGLNDYAIDNFISVGLTYRIPE